MSIGTLIQWCYATVNFWWGCCEVSTGCRNCYAKKMAKRLGRGRATWGPGGLRWLRCAESAGELLRLEKCAVKKNTRLRVFINSMSDTFEDRRDLDGARNVLFSIAPCVPHLDLLLLTKRPECVEQLVPDAWKTRDLTRGEFGTPGWPANVWLGFSGENQEMFDSRWPIVEQLARDYGIPCTFCSAEPLVGPLNIEIAQWDGGGEDEPETRPLDWLIVGGESGQSARLCNPQWIRALVNQAREFEIPVFVKQLGAHCGQVWSGGEAGRGFPVAIKDSHGGNMAEWPDDLRVRELPAPSIINRVQT